jgi:hypothetical protein
MKNPLEPLAAIAAPVKDITELLNKFLSPSLQEAGEAIGDRVCLFRLKQQTKLLQKTIKVFRVIETAGLNLFLDCASKTAAFRIFGRLLVSGMVSTGG